MNIGASSNHYQPRDNVCHSTLPKPNPRNFLDKVHKKSHLRPCLLRNPVTRGNSHMLRVECPLAYSPNISVRICMNSSVGNCPHCQEAPQHRHHTLQHLKQLHHRCLKVFSQLLRLQAVCTTTIFQHLRDCQVRLVPHELPILVLGLLNPITMRLIAETPCLQVVSGKNLPAELRSSLVATGNRPTDSWGLPLAESGNHLLNFRLPTHPVSRATWSAATEAGE